MILMWCNVGFAEWKNFTPNDPTGVYTYFDTTSIKKSDGYTRVMTLTDSPSPGPDGILSFKVLYNFDGKNENELQVEEGDILTCLDLIDDNDEWIVCLGSDGNIGSIPRSFVKCYSMPVQRKSELWENDREADLYGEDEPLCRQWRSMIGNFLHLLSSSSLDSL